MSPLDAGGILGSNKAQGCRIGPGRAALGLWFRFRTSRAADPDGPSSGQAPTGSLCAAPKAMEGSPWPGGRAEGPRAAPTVCRQHTGRPGRPGHRAGPGQRPLAAAGSPPAPRPPLQPWGSRFQHHRGAELCRENIGGGLEPGSAGPGMVPQGPAAQSPCREMLWRGMCPGPPFSGQSLPSPRHHDPCTALPWGNIRVWVHSLQTNPTRLKLPSGR